MCGIAGVVCFRDDISSLEKTIKRMTADLYHRGPDESGYYISPNALLGHQRLTIIDPEGGKQPMAKTHNGQKYIIVYNGELYNSEDLKNELKKYGYSFSSYSDTEVILTSFIHWKEDCVKKLNGIFAFAVYNETQNELFMARDHLGVKPIFFSLKNDQLVFASEIKAILKHPLISSSIGEEGVFELIGLGPARSPFCAIFKDIVELPPAHYVIYNQNGLKIKEYWQLEPQTIKMDKDIIIEYIRDLVIDAVQRQLTSDFEICTFLSGGLDSTIISTIAAQHFKKEGKILKAFSIDYKDNKLFYQQNRFQPSLDTEYAQKASKELGTTHTVIEIDNSQLADALFFATKANDLPGMADIDSSLYLFTKEVKKYAKVALSGECADEIFGGYPWYWSEDYKDSKTFPWSPSLMFRKSLLSSKYSRDKLEDYVYSKYNESISKVLFSEYDNEEEKRHKILFYLNVKWFMLTLLNRKDRMSMANSLEVRVPFADYRIVEFLYNIPWEIKYLDNMEKGLLRKAFDKIIPDVIKNRKKSPYPKTYNPIYFEKVKGKVINILKTNSSIFEIIDKDVLKNIVESQDTKFIKPWFGQLMTLPQFFGYIVQLDHWVREYDINLE